MGYDEEEKAPLGPGGLDPTEVLNSLPKEMQDAFINQDTQTLKECLSKMDVDKAECHMERCVDAGLWVQPEEEKGHTLNSFISFISVIIVIIKSFLLQYKA